MTKIVVDLETGEVHEEPLTPDEEARREAEAEAAQAERDRLEAERLADERIKRAVLATAQGAVGKRIDALTAAERNALIAVLLWRWGALNADLTIRPLADWATAPIPVALPE